MARIDRYLEALDADDLERYHDSRDVRCGRMTKKEYDDKWRFKSRAFDWEFGYSFY